MDQNDDVYLPEVLFEMQPNGRFIRVTAIDPRSGVEVVSVCDATYPIEMIKRLAARKLKFVLRKRRRQSAAGRASGPRGIVV